VAGVKQKGKAGSFKGGRKPLAMRGKTLDHDRDRKAKARAKKAGFATVAEHRASTAKKEAARAAHLLANPTPPTFVQRIIANRLLARQLVAERGRDYAPCMDRVPDYVATVGQNGVITREPLPPGDFHTQAARYAESAPAPKQADPALDPDLPPPGLGMCYWSVPQLEAHKRMLRQKNTPPGGGNGSSINDLNLRDQAMGVGAFNWNDYLLGT
jgi:hypothetical protein